MWLNLALDPAVTLTPQDLSQPLAVTINLGLVPFRVHVVQKFMHQHLEPILLGQPRIQFNKPAAYPSHAVGLVSVQLPFGDSDSRGCHSA